MKAKLLALASLASLLFLSGCNGIGDKDTLLARIDGEKVYQEDYDLLLKNPRLPDTVKNKLLYENFYSKAALTSRALSEFPELEKEWKTWFKNIEPRVLTTVYQRFYVLECLMYTESELRQFYDANRSLFPVDSFGDFRKARKTVAKLYDISKRKADYMAFVGKNATPENVQDTLLWQNKYFENRQQELQTTLMQNMRKDQRVEVNPLPEISTKGFYEHHKDMFMTVPGYEVYHIQDSDSLKLANLFAETPSLEQFKLSAVSSSKNELTAKDSGYVGRVKKGFALPYGIGMVDALAELDGKSEGYVSSTIRANNGQFHRFFLVKQVPSQLKPFDRVEKEISLGAKMGRFFEVDSSFVLISQDGKPLLTERDLLAQNEMIYKRNLNGETHSRLVEMLADFYAFSFAAEKARLNRSWEYRAMVRYMRWNFICDHYFERLKDGKNVPEEQTKALYEKIGNPEKPGLSYEDSKEILNKILAIPQNLYKRLYYLERTFSGAGVTLEQTMFENYRRLHSEYQKVFSERLSSEAYSKATVHLYDTSTPEYKVDMSASTLKARADSLMRDGLWKESVETLRTILLAYAENDSLFEKYSYESSQILSENNEFWAAELEYYAYYMMWPENPNAEKAMFSRAFILNENMKRNDDARQVLEEFLKKYPKSELRESAQWLLDNIKSDGKLADDLMKKIEAEE